MMKMGGGERQGQRKMEGRGGRQIEGTSRCSLDSLHLLTCERTHLWILLPPPVGSSIIAIVHERTSESSLPSVLVRRKWKEGKWRPLFSFSLVSWQFSPAFQDAFSVCFLSMSLCVLFVFPSSLTSHVKDDCTSFSRWWTVVTWCQGFTSFPKIWIKKDFRQVIFALLSCSWEVAYRCSWNISPQSLLWVMRNQCKCREKFE